MSKPYWSGPGTLKGSGDSGYRDHADHRHTSKNTTGVTDSYHGYYPEEDLNYPAEDYEDYDSYEGSYASYDQHDTKWRWVAICAAVVLLVAVAATAVLMYGSDSSTKSAIPTQQGWRELTPSTTPRTVIATVPPSTPSAAPLPSETVVTVTTTPADTAPPAPPETPAAAVPAPNTITYTVTGSRQLLDLVSVIYTDEQGFPRTDVNVALPWTKTVVLNPGVEIKSVTATSLLGHLNCAITDSSGAILSVQTNNSMIATCTP
ncbi:hypothetical protein [Mycolicibacterium komossense]|uniref:MmpS3 protein n=1 Tax=Mycolicibacterium komossense TaxID=1779 RepID=A0ABT3CCW3_9MYCO|nr:hypothetical protein [Mycolicibacterium komossense]MCV7227086.1 hypothetical protein [Mycolicibacterium komossense]